MSDNTHLLRELRDLAGDLHYCYEAAQKRGEPGDPLTPKLMFAAVDEIERLRARQEELLATIVRVTNETPYPDEIKGWEGQRAKMIAEIGTLRADAEELKRLRDKVDAYYGLQEVVDEMLAGIRSLVKRTCHTPLLVDGMAVAVDEEELKGDKAPILRKTIATAEEMFKAIDWKFETLNTANEYLRSQQRHVLAVRDDARAASQRDIEAKRRAWATGVQACIDTVKQRHDHFELYRCTCARPGEEVVRVITHRDDCKGQAMSTHPATFAILDEIYTFLSALLSRGERP